MLDLLSSVLIARLASPTYLANLSRSPAPAGCLRILTGTGIIRKHTSIR